MEFLSPEEYAMRDFAAAVEHLNHAKGQVLPENIQRQLFSIWSRVTQGPPPSGPPPSSLDAAKRAQFVAWQDTTGLYKTKLEASTAYVELVTRHDPLWREDGSQEKKSIPTHIKAQLKHSGIRVVVSSSSSDGNSDSEEDDETKTTKTTTVVAPVKSIFEAVRAGRRYTMFLPKEANAIDPDTASSVLMIAVDSEQVGAVAALLAAGSDVHWVDPEDGSTVLHCAALLGSLPIVQLLLNAGADPLFKDSDGLTCIDVAEQEHLANIVEVLQAGCVE
jgi:hypothetical protein